MKKTLFFAAAAICAAALAVSCENMEVVSDVQHDYRTVTLQLPTPDTKVAISEENGKIKWVAGDEIIVHGQLVAEMQTITLADADISADGLTATITFDASQMTPYGDHDYYAQYPASATHPSSSTNAYHYCEFNDTNKPLMGAYLDSQTNTFIFRNLCGIISFKINGDYDEYQFVGNNEEVVGYKQYGIKRTATDTYVREPGEALYAISGSLVADGNTPNLICIAPTYIKDVSSSTTTFSGGFSIRLKKNGEIVKVVKSSKEFTLHRNEYVVLGDISNRIEDYVPETHQNKITGATNLGATETANCYIVEAAGSYKIPAVMGNSSTSVGTVAGAKLVWETYNNAEDVAKNSIIAAVDYEDDAVFFKTPDALKPGNALIAALDADENIIWSWHIWIPATAIEEVGSYSVSAKYLMDRNLGALNAAVAGNSPIDITSIGLFYQWGRKDPFVGPREINEGQYPSKAKVAGEERTEEKVQISLAESIAKPTLFARGLYVNNKQVNPDWCSDQNGEYWGDSGDKSIYDPCPAGYRVPKRDKTKLLWADSMSGYEYSANNYWFKVGDPAVVFPAAGWIDGGSVKTTCRFGIWNAHHDSGVQNNPEEPTYGYGSYAAYARRFYIESGSVKLKNSSVYKSLGYSVRCESISNSVPKPQEPDKKGATSVVLDGNFDDWANADAISNSGDIKEWKFGYDANNLYFYFKIARSSIIAGHSDAFVDGLGYSFAWRRYIYIGLDTDNSTASGAAASDGGLTITGCEAKALVYPFRGYSQSDSGTDGSEVLNGVDEQGWIKCPVDTKVEDAHLTAYGKIEEDYGYLEIGIPRDKIGSPAAGKMNVQFSLSSNLTGEQVITIQ